MAKAATATAPARRVRPRQGIPAVSNRDKAQAEEQLSALRSIMIKIDALQVKLREGTDELEKFMKGHKINNVALEDIVAEIVTPMGRKTNIIDAMAFFEKVPMDVFVECATISVTKAKDHLAGKELEEITTVIPAEKKPPKLEIKMVKKKMTKVK